MRRAAVLGVSLAAGATLAACGGGSSAPATSAPQQQQQQQQSTDTVAPPGGLPGAIDRAGEVKDQTNERTRDLEDQVETYSK